MKYQVLLFFIIILFSCSSHRKISPSSTDFDLLITNARIITGTGKVLENASLAISGNKIVAVNAPKNISAKTVIDASGKTVLPGLIDAHAHIFFSPRYPMQIKSEEEMADFMSKDLPAKLNEYLQIGVTTLFSPGDYWPYIKNIKDNLNKGTLTGPRLYIAGPILTAPGGHPPVTVCQGSSWCAEHLAKEVGNRETAKRVVLQLVQDGVDAIKLVYDDGRRIKYNQLQDSVLQEIVRVAHENKISVYAHTPSDERSTKAIQFGVDALVHAPVQSEDKNEELINAILKKRTPITSTLSVLAPFTSASNLRVTYFGAPYPDQMEQRLKMATTNLKSFTEKGVLIAFGTDTPMQPAAEGFYKELDVFINAGIDNLKIIESMTKNAAIFLKKDHLLGTVEENKLADLLIVDGNPVVNMDDVKKVRLVLKDGKIVVNK